MTREEALEFIAQSVKSDVDMAKVADAIKVIEQEPTTKNDLVLIHTEGLDEEIRCTMCTNYMKSDRGCDGSCVVNKDMYKAVMDAIEKRIQPTTKNDLGDDCISRKAAEDITWQDPSYTDPLNILTEVRDKIKELPSVTPQLSVPEVTALAEWTEKLTKAIEDAYNKGYADGVKSVNICPHCGEYIGEEE